MSATYTKHRSRGKMEKVIGQTIKNDLDLNWLLLDQK